jgi:hypothetical protein
VLLLRLCGSGQPRSRLRDGEDEGDAARRICRGVHMRHRERAGRVGGGDDVRGLDA